MLQCYDTHLTLLQINEYIQHGVIIYVALAYFCHIVFVFLLLRKHKKIVYIAILR
jgi:hypothetical protein